MNSAKLISKQFTDKSLALIKMIYRILKCIFILFCLFSTTLFGYPLQPYDVEYTVELNNVSNRIDTLTAYLADMQTTQNDMIRQLDAIKKVFEHTNDDGQFEIKAKIGKFSASQVDNNLLKRVYRQVDPDEVAFTAELTKKLENIPIGTIVALDHLVYSTDSSYDPSTGVFTCPTSGLYLFSVFVESATNRQATVSMKRDGIEISLAISEPSETGEDDSGGNLVLVPVTKGSRVWLETRDDNNQSLWTSFTTFSGVLIHRYRN